MKSILGEVDYRLRSAKKKILSKREAESLLSWPPGVLREPGDTVKHILEELVEDRRIKLLDNGSIEIL